LGGRVQCVSAESVNERAQFEWTWG
jgi:hypothetical protein